MLQSESSIAELEALFALEDRRGSLRHRSSRQR
jgi:hypothetical protein